MGESASTVCVLAPTFEQHHDGFSVHCPRPRISWRFSCNDEDIRNWKQAIYEVEISSEDRGGGQVFKIESADSSLVPWPCLESLDSRARRRVRVRCHGQYTSLSSQRGKSGWTEWSPWSLLEIALLKRSDWTAHMITVSESWPLGSDQSVRPLRFYRSFNLSPNRVIERARLYVTSHGLYSAQINNNKVGDHCLSPGFQSYHKRLHYQTYDVGELVTAGSNRIEVEVAAGWFASAWSWDQRRCVYGQKLGVMAQLEIWIANSPVPVVVDTDHSWKASTSATLTSEIYDGEIYDQSLKTTPSAEASFSVEVSSIPVSRLVSPDAPPVRVVDRVKPRHIFKSASGKTVVDFGQNLAGRISVRKVQKPPGHSIIFRHAEVMQDDEIATRPLRTAKSRDVLICDGNEIINWHPNFTFHGFRYIEITGWSPDDRDDPLTKFNISAEVLHTDMSRTGWFSCSNQDLNQLHQNSLWGMKSNFLSIPMECPSRDERMGWTGDLSIFIPTAAFLYNTAGMLKHWLDDLYLDQMEESKYWRQGVVPLFVPNCLLRTDQGGHAWDPMPNGVWGDAAIIVPWMLYRASGDIDLLSRQYDSMVQWLEQGVVRNCDGLWDPDQWQFGDWLDPRAPQNDSGRGTTDGTFVADCFLINSTRIVAEVAKLLGNSDSSRFGTMTERLLRSWRSKYLTPAGLVAPDTATALSLAITFELLPHVDSLKEEAASRLFRIIRLNDFKLTTGFVGSSFLPGALARAGGVELGYALLFQKQYPSYLYPITMGATTAWERWDSMLPDGRVNPGSMTSFNHHALGSIAHWMHTDIGGLEAVEPGWKVFRVNPKPNQGLTWVATTFDSTYGRVELRWSLDGETFRMALRVPPNTSAIITMPDADGLSGFENVKERMVGSGHYTLECRFIQTDWPPKALLPQWGRAGF